MRTTHLDTDRSVSFLHAHIAADTFAHPSTLRGKIKTSGFGMRKGKSGPDHACSAARLRLLRRHTCPATITPPTPLVCEFLFSASCLTPLFATMRLDSTGMD